MIHHLAVNRKAHRKPKPDAIKKRFAADYALNLCERFWREHHDRPDGQVLPGDGASFGDLNVAGMVELRVPPHVVEVTVKHIVGTRSGVTGTYKGTSLRMSARRRSNAGRRT